jgi:hypothetical protein
MWLEIVVKSPGNNSDENKANLKRLKGTVKCLVGFLSPLVLVLLAMNQASIAAGVIILVLIGNIIFYHRSSRKLAVMICKNYFEIGPNPSPEQLPTSAEKSGHKAAKSILRISKHMEVGLAFFIVSLGLFSVTVKRHAAGVMPYAFVHCFLLICLYVQTLFRGYVRQGANKKLAANGFATKSSKVGSSTTTSTVVGSSVDP